MYSEEVPLEIGGVQMPNRFVERQKGPECGFEAIENTIQMFHPASNNVSERDLKPWAQGRNLVVWTGSQVTLSVSGYKPALKRWNIDASWFSFDHAKLANSLRQNRVVIAVVDAHILDPLTYAQPESWHAVVITNFVSTGAPRIPILAYAGVDSNFPGQVRRWPAERMAAAVRAFSDTPLLVTRTAVAQRNWSNYEILIRHSDKRYGVRLSPTP